MQRVTSADLWLEPHKRKLLTQTYHFDEVQIPEETSAALSKRCPAETFIPKGKNVSVPECRKLPGSKAPSWPSFTAATSVAMAEGLNLLTHLHELQDLSAVGKTWKSKLVQAGLLALRSSKEDAFISFGCLWHLLHSLAS